MATEKTITGKLTDVYATGGKFTIVDDSGKEWNLRLMDARYWDTGAEFRSYKAALRVKKLVGRQVMARAENHNTFGWTVFGGNKIRLAAKRRAIEKVG